MTVANLTRFENLDPADYGERIQFASNFEASDGTMYAFSQRSAQELNSFQITNAADASPNAAMLTTVDNIAAVDIDAANISNPFIFTDPEMNPPEMALVNDRLDGLFQPTTNGAGQLIGERLEQPDGLTTSLIESNGRIFGARTITFAANATADYRTSGIHWFELQVDGMGGAPELFGTRNPNSHVIIDETFLGDNNGDFIAEYGAVSFFNPSIAYNDETGLISVVYNGASEFYATSVGVVPLANAIRTSSFASVGIRVNGAPDPMDGSFPNQSIQLEPPAFLGRGVSLADDAYVNPNPFNFWGTQSSVRSDPFNPNSFFATVPFVETTSDEWTVQVVEVRPIDLRPIIEASDDNDTIIIRHNQDMPNVIEIEINGVVTEQFDENFISQIIVLAGGGDDTIISDH
ncbi:MAG: hypothetical protein AAGA30_21640, partial [Planctomycetota bacterium]